LKFIAVTTLLLLKCGASSAKLVCTDAVAAEKETGVAALPDDAVEPELELLPLHADKTRQEMKQMKVLINVERWLARQP
jgi:hypothetical protein